MAILCFIEILNNSTNFFLHHLYKISHFVKENKSLLISGEIVEWPWRRATDILAANDGQNPWLFCPVIFVVDFTLFKLCIFPI